ncbi:hypothetical protein GDO81_014801 [Engystomops pustulosus]|uniref:Uncharacterized protein n=1 Tax=Engystomops pustulosus TaxID=76066 RepID=A0AAV7AJG2_ENGPU|nr:hypothetical protein GDO81_014801 [Engystomops pustulosus]
MKTYLELESRKKKKNFWDRSLRRTLKLKFLSLNLLLEMKSGGRTLSSIFCQINDLVVDYTKTNRYPMRRNDSTRT